MVLAKKIKDKKVNIEFNKEFIKIIEEKIKLSDSQFIDNSLKFFDVAKILDKKMNFAAIQNGARHDLLENKYLYEKKIIKKDFTKNFYIPNYFCFGQYDVDRFKQFRKG